MYDVPGVPPDDIMDTVIKVGLYIGAVFQLICIAAVIILPDKSDSSTSKVSYYLTFYSYCILSLNPYKIMYELFLFKDLWYCPISKNNLFHPGGERGMCYLWYISPNCIMFIISILLDKFIYNQYWRLNILS